jgi:plasmid replication initiation protein
MAKITKDNTKEINNLTTNVAVILNEVKNINNEVGEIKNQLDCVVTDEKCRERQTNFNNYKTKIDTLWDDRNRLLGWIAGISVVAGSAGGGIAYLLNSLSKVMAR